MEWFIIIPIMFLLFALNMRIYLAMFAAVLCYFIFFAQIPLQIAVQRLIAPTQNSSLLAIPFSSCSAHFWGPRGSPRVCYRSRI